MLVAVSSASARWRARWDLNPGFSAPEADVLIRAIEQRLRQTMSASAYLEVHQKLGIPKSSVQFSFYWWLLRYNVFYTKANRYQRQQPLT